MNIEVVDKTISKKFSKGEIVFKIITDEKNIGMVTTRHDYEKKLTTHVYQPLLYCIDLPLKLAYLYGTLNNSYNNKIKDKHTFMWRELKNNEWNVWFIVHPYDNLMYYLS